MKYNVGTLIIILAVATMGIFLSHPARAKGNANGVPFNEIQGNITLLNQSLTSLEAKTNLINASLSAQLSSLNHTTISQINAVIANLTSLRSSYRLLNGEVSSFQNSIDAITSGLSSLTTKENSDASNLNSRITALNASVISNLNTMNVWLNGIENTLSIVNGTLSSSLSKLHNEQQSFEQIMLGNITFIMQNMVTNDQHCQPGFAVSGFDSSGKVECINVTIPQDNDAAYNDTTAYVNDLANRS